MWKAAFGGRSERGGSTVGVDDAASAASRRRRHRRGSNDDKSMVSSTSRRTDGDRDRDRKRHSRHESGVSYGSAPIPRLTESAVNAFNANDDDDDIWEDEADLKSERKSEHKRSDSRERRRRKSSGRSERSRSRERDSKSKKSSGRGERSRSRERDGWTRKSSGRSERSRSRDREDRDRKKKDERSSRTERPNGKSRVSEIVDNADAVSVMPSTFSIDQYPSVNIPSTVRFDEHTMSGALDSHVPNQFPGQNPSTYTKSDFEPNPHGAAADYYQDKGQSVKYQPGERAFTPNITGSSSVAAPSGSTKPTKPAKSTKQSSSSSSSVKPSRKSSRGISPPAESSIIPAAAAVAGAYSSSKKSSRAVSPPAANHHMQARASTQYEPSSLSHNDYANSRPAPSEFSVMPPSEFSAMPPSEFSAMPSSEFSAMPPSVISGLPQSTMSGQAPGPIRYNSEPPPTAGAASSYYASSELPPSVPAHSGKYAAAGAAAAGLAAYGMSQHNQHSQQSEHHQHTQYTEHTQHTHYNDNSSRYGRPHSQYGPQAPYTPERPGPYYQSAPNSVSMGMQHHHEHKGPISRLKDGFLNLLSSPEDVAKMEEYTEYIGVCKHCFDPRSSPYAGPRKHHYHPKKKDSFETLRRRSLERMQRRRSDESLRRTNSKVQKENRYYSSDRKSSSNAGYMAGGLAVAGAATAGAAMFNDRKNFDDTYSVKSGHRASSAIRRRGSQSSIESTRRRTSRGRISSDRHDEFITVRTKDGRVENRKVHRSRSGSAGRKSNWIGSAAGGAALGAAGAAATSRHRRRSSPDQVSLRHGERRYRSRSSSRSHSPGLGEIFGFSEPRSRRSGRRSPFGSYQDSRKEQQRRKEKGGFFNFSNGSASSSESGMAFGDINGSMLSRKSSGKRKVSKKSSDEKLKATLLGIGATAAALTAAQKLSKSPKPGPRPELGARRNVRVSQYGPDGRKSGPPSDEGEWVDELPSGESSDESALAFDDGNGRRRLSSRPSMDSVGSSSSSNDGLSAWGWRWGSKKQKKQKKQESPSYSQEQRQHSMSNIPVAGPAAAGMAAGAVYDAYGRRVPSDVGLVDSASTSQAPMQYIEPQPLSDVSSRHPSMPGAFEDPPLQQPQPIAPFQPSFTQGSPEDPLKATAGPSSKPPMRRSVSSPTRNSRGSFMGDAAFIGGAAVATAGIIASQNRKGSPGNVRFGLNGEQQEKFDREIREERAKEDAERRRADRTRALKEEAERFAREEDEKRALAERKRRQQEEEEREHQRQIEANQREEAYRREQARNAEESRRRAEEARQAEEEERQRFNDRQIREELERKQMEREEKSRKKKDKSTNERSQDSSTSWKGPVAAGVAGALAGAVLDGALHKQGHEDARDEPRSREAAYSTQTFEPTNEHSGAPITDDDLVDPDFFKRRHSPADFRRYEELSNEKLEELTHEREDYYNMPAQSQKDFFMPKELLEKEAEGKERVADPYGDNEVDVYQTTGGEARHIYGNDFGRYGKAPVIHQNVPKLNVIAPTPPHSTAGSTKGDRSAPPSPLADLPEDNIGSKRAKDHVAADVAPDANEATRHMPGGFEDSVYRDQQHPDAADTQELAWEPPLSKKDKKKRDKASKRESVIESEPVTPLEEVIQDVSASRSVPFDAPQEDFAAPTSKKDKKKKGKKQSSTFDDEPTTSPIVEAEREAEPVITAEPAAIEEEFAPLSKKDKKKKSKKGMSFDDSEPTTPASESPRVDAYFAPDVPQDRAIDPVAEENKETESFQPLSKKDKKKKGKKGSTFEDSEPSTPVNEVVEPELEPAADVSQAELESVWEPPLSKKEQKKREKAAKMGLLLEDSRPSSPNNERSMPDLESEPVAEVVEPAADSTWEPPLSKKEKKKREKDVKASAIAEEAEIATPLEEPTEPWSETRQPEAEAAWEPPISKKDKKKREKEAKTAFALDTSEPSTPLEEPASRDIDPVVQDAEASFEPPLSKKEKKKREKEAQRLSMTLGDSPSDTPANERSDPLLEQSKELDAEPLISSQEVAAEPEWEPPLSKKEKKKREKEAQKLSESFDDHEPKAAVDDFGGVELEREPGADAPWEPPLSKKDKKKRDKESKRQSVSFEEPEPSAHVDEFIEPEQSRDAEADAAWEPPLSKKEQKKRDKEAKSFGFGDVAAAVMTTAGVAAIADAASKSEEEDYSTGKKSKKNKKKGSSFDESPQSTQPSDMPGAWDESSSDAKDFSAADRDLTREDTSSPSQELPADDFGSSDTKKSKKKKKRESGRFNEPATGSPLRSEIAFDDYLGDAVSTNGDAQSSGYGRGGRGPSYYDDDYPKTSSPRNMSPDDAKSSVSAPGLERRTSSKSRSKRRSGVYEDAADFDDNRSIYSAATAAPALERRTSSKSKRRSGAYEDSADFDDARSIRSSATEPASSSSKKEKKGGIFGLFSRKSSDGDKRDQSFLGDRVEDLPPLPLSQTSAISASAQEEQDNGTPASADAVDQAVTNDPLLQDAPKSGSIYTEAVPGGVNMDIWGDPMGDAAAQPDNGEDVWGDEEFADRPSLPREATLDPTLDPIAVPVEGATPARTGGPMTNLEEDFDDWFGSTDPAPKAPLLIKGKKGKKAKKGKAAQAKSSTPSSPAPSSPVAESSKELLTASPVDLPAVSGTLEAEKTRDVSVEEAANKDLPVGQADVTENPQVPGPEAQGDNAVEPASTAPLSDAHAIEHPEEQFHDQFTRRPSLTPRPLSSTAVPLRFRPIPSSPSHPKERSLSFGSNVESAPISPASATGSNKKPRPRSSEFREVRPLYLVSRNSKLEDVEEQLPDLPDSKPSSRASSVQGSEDWHSAAEDMSPQPDLYQSPGSARKNLTIDLDQANQYRTEEEIMDTADQTTPKASDFPQTAFMAPKSHSKQVPQFYTWEDLAKDEEMHEAAARQAEGTVEPEAAPPADTVPAEGLGIDQAGDESSSAPARKSKKDKRKNKGLAAAALLAGGAAAAMAMEGDKSVDETTPASAEAGSSEESKTEQAISDSPPSEVGPAADVSVDNAPKEVPDDAATVIHDDPAEDLFAPTATKKSKKAKKNKKAQSAPDDTVQTPPMEQEPTPDVPTEGAAAEYYAATEEAMAKGGETPAAEPVSGTIAALAEAEATPAEDEWASLSTSKKGKKAKKGKKQKADALAEPEPAQTPSGEPEVAAPSEPVVPELSGAAADDSNIGPVATDNNDASKSAVSPEFNEVTGNKNALPAAETDAVNVDKPSTSVEPAAETAPKKDAAASSSRGWFSWPWGAKKGAEEGLEVDPVTMQAREMPAEAKDAGAEILNAEALTEGPVQDKTDDAVVAVEPKVQDEAVVPENSAQDAFAITDLPKDEKISTDTSHDGAPTVEDASLSEPAPGDAIEAPGEEQTVVPAAEEPTSQAASEPTEVADEFWGAPSSKKKKKGKKGKKSGQSTPLTTDEPQEPVKVEDTEAQDKDVAVTQEPQESQESQTSDNQTLGVPKTDEAQPIEEDSFCAPQPSKKKGKKGKKSDLMIEQTAEEPVTETSSVAAEPAIDQASAQEASVESNPADPVEVTNVDEQKDTENLPASLSTKKKGKKNKKASAAASASWDELVAEDTPIESTLAQADETTAADPQPESLETTVDAGPSPDTPAPAPDAAGQEAVEPTPEPEAEDIWAALPSKKKGKKGKKAAKEISDYVQHDPPQNPEITPMEDVTRSLDAEASEPAPSEPAEAILEQTADAPSGEQETPVAEPEDFWAPQPKGKKAKKGKKARQDAVDEPVVLAEASEVPLAENVDANSPVAEDTEPIAPPAKPLDGLTTETAKEANDEDLWGAPAKGKKAKKGKKNKSIPESFETPQSEAVDTAPEPLPSADSDLPKESSQEPAAAAANDKPVPEPSVQPDVVAEDDWSSLTTSKKGKKAKKSKKAALTDDMAASEPLPGDPPAEETKTDTDVLDSATTGAEPSVEQDAVAVQTLALPATTESEALPEPAIEQSADNTVQTETAPANDNASVDNTLEQPTLSEPAAVPDAGVTPAPEATSFDDSKETPTPDLVSDKDIAAIEVDARETPAAEEVTEFEPLPTKKSKKDKKKNKKAHTLDTEEPPNATLESVDNQVAGEDIAKDEESSGAVENLMQDASQPEADLTFAPEEPAAQSNEPVPAEPEEDFGSFSTKKSKKDKKKGKKGKATEVEDMPTPSSPQTGTSGDVLIGESADHAPVLDETLTPAAETKGAAADYYAAYPDSDKPLTTETDNLDDKDLLGEQSTERELAEEVSEFPTSTKSKKDKKKAKKAALASSSEVQDQESPSMGDEQPSTTVVEDAAPVETQTAETDPAEEFGASSAKSKKDKKKAKKALASSRDAPEESTDPVVDEAPPTTATEEIQPVEAEPVDEFGSFSSKKSKKDKKKSKKAAFDSWDATETDNVVPTDAATQFEPESKAADEPPIDASHDILNSVISPAVEPPVPNENESAQDPAVSDTKAGDDVQANDGEELSLSTKKSKKDKKKAKKSKGAAFEDFSEQTDVPTDIAAEAEPAAKDESATVSESRPDLTAPAPEPAEESSSFLPVDAQPIDESNAAATEVLPVPEEVTRAAEDTANIDQQTAVPDAPQVEEDTKINDFDAFPTKKSKKDKKKTKKGQSAVSPWDEPEPSTPVDETSREISEAADNPDETSKASEDTAPAVDAPEVPSILETQEDPASTTDTPAAHEDIDFFSPSTTKKSKKDKKKAKKGQAASLDDSETVTPLVEAPIEATEPAIAADSALEAPTTDPALEEAPSTAEAAPEQTPAFEFAPPQEETEDFGFSSTKKSKKDKKKAKITSQALPWDEEPTVAEPAIEQSSDKQDIIENNDRSLAVDQDPVATETTVPVETSEPLPVTPEDPADVDGEAFGSFSTRKSKKDKKKGKKAQEADLSIEEPAQLRSTDQEVSKVDPEPNESAVAQETDKAPDASAAEPEMTSQPPEADADDLWAAPAKKSKKDKKKGKKGQVEEEVVPTADNEAPIEVPASADDQQPSTGLDTAEAAATESTTPNATETTVEDDAWGSISTKKSKKDKKKSKKSKANEEDVSNDQSAVPVEVDAPIDAPAADETFRDENKVIDTQDVPTQLVAELSTNEVEMTELVPETFDPAQAGSTDPMTASEEPARPETSDIETKNVDEKNHDQAKATESADAVVSDKPEQDIDFAATLAAGLADSGFDPNLVVDDPVFHRRASPPTGVAEADPEEVVTTSSKKKKGKGKKTREATVEEPIVVDTTPAASAPDDFDAALSQGLQDSGFDPSLLANASSPTAVDTKDDEDEFFFAKSNKKKKKGKKALAEAEDAPSSAPEAPQDSEQQATLETSLEEVPAIENNAAIDASPSQIAAPEDALNPESEQATLEDVVANTGSEPTKAAEDEWAAPSKSKKKSKKDMKKQDRSIDVEDVAVPPTETLPELGVCEIADIPTEPSAGLDIVPGETPVATEATGEEEWGAPSKKKKGKKGKKQQESDSQKTENITTPLETPAEPAIDDQSGPSVLTEQPKSDSMEVDSAPAEQGPPENVEQPEQAVDDEWAAPAKKKKGKKGKKQQDSDLQGADITEPSVDTPSAPVEVEGATQADRSADQVDTLIPDAEPASTDTVLPTDVEQSAPVADDEWGAPSKKKKKGKKGKAQQAFDLQDEQGSASPALDEAVPAVDPIDVTAESTIDVTETTEAVSDNTTALLDTTPLAVSPSDEPVTANLEATATPDEDEWGALSSKKKKGKKGKKIQAYEATDEKSSVPVSAEPSVPSEDIATPEQQSSTDTIAHDNTELPETPLPVVVNTEEPEATNEDINEAWDAPSTKKDKKKKKKKGIEWSEPDDTAQGASRALVDEPALVHAETPDNIGAIPRDVEESKQPESGDIPVETPIVSESIEPAVDDWAAPTKKKKSKKGKKNEDALVEPQTPVAADAEPMAPEALVADEPPAPQSEDATISSSSVDQPVASTAEDIVAADQVTGPVAEPAAEPAEEEWGLSSKKKGKKNKKKLASNEPDAEPAPLDVSADPVVLGSDPMIIDESTENRDMPPGESSSRALTFDDDSTPKSPAPADATANNWDLPVKKNTKKGKKNQLWTEEEPQATTPGPLPTPDPSASFGTSVNDNATTAEQSEQPAERSLDVQTLQDVTPAPDVTTEQPATPVEEEQWGLPSKKKGKKNKKKGAASDADLDPFISTPVESSAPISTTDTGEVSAVEDGEPAAVDAIQPTGEMDIDEMDKAYKAYKKNKRKQKKIQAVSGEDNEKAAESLPESSEQQQSTSRDLSIPQETEPARQPSPLASEEPTWSFAKLEESGDTSRGLTKMPSHGSLTSRRSLEPLRVDTTSPSALDSNNTQVQQEPQLEAPGSTHRRMASKDTPLEPTSRDRASYLFQSPAPFQESTPNNASQFRTPEHRGDASDYFHSRGVDPVKDESAGGPLSPSAGLMSPINALDPIPEEHAAHKRSIGDATNITPMEPAGKMLRRTETPKAIREKSLLSSASKDGLGSSARSISNPTSGIGIADADRSLKRVVSDTRSPSAMSNRSGFSANHPHVSPEDRRTLSRASNRSVTPTLRRTNLSGDLRAASRTSNRRGDSGSAVGARASPKTIPFEPPPTPPLNDDEDQGDPGATRAAGMAETFQGYGGGQVSQVSPTRPPSMRKRQSMHVMDLESKLEQLTEENRALQEAQQSRGLDGGSMDADNHGLQQALDARELELREKNNEIQHIQAMLEPMQQEITRLVQLNSGLTEANRNLVDDNNGRFATLQSEHANITQQWQSTTRELETMRQEHSRLSNGMRDAVAAQLSTALAEKDHEIRKLKDELAEAADRIRALQVQIQSSKTSDFLNVRDEDYFDGACQKLCQHVQQWVLRFSKMSDNRICRLSSDLRDEKIEARLDNALLDGMDVDKLLGDRVRRRDVFMSVVMTMVWEYVFTRYLFGMDREQRQKLKALEKTLSEVGPPRAVAQWRATTLTLLAKRPAFSKQCALDTEAVAHEIFGVLSALLTPPSGTEQQLLTSLTKVITVAVNLSVEMRTQRAEYIMLPPLQPEYDTNGDLVRKVHFNASLMNERSGLFTSNEALEAERAIVKIVLFPLVVKKGDEYGEGEEEIVVCPAQVLVHNDSGKSRKVVRVMSGAMEIDDPRRSKQSLISRQGSMQF
ncbi:hypothetical protein MBLNU13_g08574t2 [Cladosporium sp. NU13]